MGKIAARKRTSFVDHAQVAIQKDTGIVRVAKHPARRRTRCAVGIHLYHLLVGDAEEGSDDADFGRTYIHDRVPATIRASSAIGTRRDIVRKDVEGFD